MAKNAVFQFMRENQRLVDFDGELPGYIYQHREDPDLTAVMTWIGDPTIALFCDSNIFAGTNLGLVDAVTRRQIVLTPEVSDELAEYLAMEPRSSADALVHALLKAVPAFVLPEDRPYSHVYAAFNYYLNLLAIRRTTLQALIEARENQLGRPLRREEREQLGTQYGRATRGTGGVATKNVQQAKERAIDRMTDEVLVVRALFEAIWTRRSVVLLSFDDDVFSQFFRLISLLADDYLSNLVAADISVNPTRYPVRHEIARYPDLNHRIKDKTRSYTLDAHAEIGKLFPPCDDEPFVAVVKPLARPQIISTLCLAGVRQFLEVKSRTGGRNVERDDGLNCYIQLPAAVPRGRLVYFLDDRLLDEQHPIVRISEADRLRSIIPLENPLRINVPIGTLD